MANFFSNEKEFTSRKRMINLVRKEHRNEFLSLVERLRPQLMDGDTADGNKLTRIDIDESKIKHSRRRRDENKITKGEFIGMIADFLFSIGRGQGLEVPLESFIRYLASPRHSSIGWKYNSLKTMIHRKLSYLESKK